jgi:hypothetical protein
MHKVYKRMRTFRRMSALQQDEAGRELLQTGCGPAAFFDLLALRKTARNRAGQVGMIRTKVYGSAFNSLGKFVNCQHNTSTNGVGCWEQRSRKRRMCGCCWFLGHS